ncbi:MAG: competence/damage-inducible protein A [Clostridiales bacterium]|nr:competence/damage-inducible protein A [Clostridiales bacterium]
MNFSAEIIAVGTELLLGNITNSDAKEISEALSGLGINVYFHTVVGDNPQRLKSAVEIAKSRADIIITTGGLGPTFDDLTKQTVAECFGKALVFHEEEADRIRGYFRGLDRQMTDNNLAQAYLPENCTILVNSCGTAPGCAFESGGKHVIMLPGPPRECGAMLHSGAVPYLRNLSDSEIVSHNIRIFGMGESAVEDKLRPLMTALDNPTLAPYAKTGEVSLRVTAKAKTHEEADRMMKPVIAQVSKTLGDYIYGIDVDSLEEAVLQLLIKKKLTLAAAESCTGGLFSKRITDIPGASQAFIGSVVSYAIEAKTSVLGVSPDLITQFGAVSRETAQAMANGALKLLKADLAVGITGVAGPGSDEKGNAVGTVFVALASAEKTFCRALQLGNDRDRVRITAAHHAFDMLRRYLTGAAIGDMEHFSAFHRLK